MCQPGQWSLVLEFYLLGACYIKWPSEKSEKGKLRCITPHPHWFRNLVTSSTSCSCNFLDTSAQDFAIAQCSDGKKEIEEVSTWRVRETSPCKFTPASSVPPRTRQSTLLPTFMVHCPMDCVHWATAVRWAQGNSSNKCWPTDGSLWKQNNWRKINDSSQNQCNALFKPLNVDKLGCGGCELWSVSI